MAANNVSGSLNKVFVDVAKILIINQTIPIISFKITKRKNEETKIDFDKAKEKKRY